jgi:hypothetical protein
MYPDKITTTIGVNDIGHYFGDGDCRTQFTHAQMDALIFAQFHAQALADAFVNYCKMTFASGSIPSCFRQDLSPEEIRQIQENLPCFQANFATAIFKTTLIFDW